MNLKAMLVGSALVLASSPAMSLNLYAPPKQYQGEPKVPVHVYRMTQTELRKACKVAWYVPGIIAGCAKLLPKGNPDRCSVFIMKHTIPNPMFPLVPQPLITPEQALEHELGHCNGWAGNHPYPQAKKRPSGAGER